METAQLQGAAAQLCREIRAYLEQRGASLSEAVRRYPTPIARCDEQLPGLLESRREVLRLLEELDATLVAAFAAAAVRWDDPAVLLLVAKAQRALRKS
ncbi:MAG TPA: hypothetical protein VFN70_08700 [Burkholderiales bacterium]|nr:hypothetical protein [Burkholderiales bacterium]